MKLTLYYVVRPDKDGKSCIYCSGPHYSWSAAHSALVDDLFSGSKEVVEHTIEVNV